MEISFSSYSIADDHIATQFGTCHDSSAVVPCAKYCSVNCISIWMIAKWNFHHIWIVMEKLLVKWPPGSFLFHILSLLYRCIIHKYMRCLWFKLTSNLFIVQWVYIFPMMHLQNTALNIHRWGPGTYTLSHFYYMPATTHCAIVPGVVGCSSRVWSPVLIQGSWISHFQCGPLPARLTCYCHLLFNH